MSNTRRTVYSRLAEARRLLEEATRLLGAATHRTRTVAEDDVDFIPDVAWDGEGADA